MPISQIVTNSITTGAVSSPKLASGVPTRAQLPSGSVLQVIQTTKTDLFSTTSTSWTDWTGMSVTITPQSSSSKFLIMVTSGVSNTLTNSFQYVKLVRNGTDIALGDTAGPATRCWIDAALQNSAGFDIIQKTLSGVFLDSPATTSALTYKLQVIRTANGTAFFGRTADIADANRSSIPSTITVMEVAG